MEEEPVPQPRRLVAPRTSILSTPQLPLRLPSLVDTELRPTATLAEQAAARADRQRRLSNGRSLQDELAAVGFNEYTQGGKTYVHVVGPDGRENARATMVLAQNGYAIKDMQQLPDGTFTSISGRVPGQSFRGDDTSFMNRTVDQEMSRMYLAEAAEELADRGTLRRVNEELDLDLDVEAESDDMDRTRNTTFASRSMKRKRSVSMRIPGVFSQSDWKRLKNTLASQQALYVAQPAAERGEWDDACVVDAFVEDVPEAELVGEWSR
jgi:hypothetical protein